VVVSNAGSGATSSWTARWTFPGGQQVASGWSGVFTQSGAAVTVASEPYNGAIAPGGSVTIGFTASGTAPASLVVTC
jgi:cellulase/cellobiase CelA1